MRTSGVGGDNRTWENNIVVEMYIVRSNRRIGGEFHKLTASNDLRKGGLNMEKAMKELSKRLKRETSRSPWFVVRHENKLVASQIIPRLLEAIELPFVGPFWTYREAMEMLHRWN